MDLDLLLSKIKVNGESIKAYSATQYYYQLS